MTTPLAQVAYAAYGATTGGLNYRGEPMPEWADLGDRIQGAWIAAAHAVVDAVEDRSKPEPREWKPVPTHRHLRYECAAHRTPLGGCKCMIMDGDEVEVRTADCVSWCPS
jgi:hypothetical protein